jgi:hypothetical protein
MDRETEKQKDEQDSKPYWFERLPTGQKVMCCSARRHGKKIVSKRTFEEIEREFRKA